MTATGRQESRNPADEAPTALDRGRRRRLDSDYAACVTVARVLKGLSEAESDPAASNASVRRERASEPVQPSERASEGRTTTGAVGRTDGREEGGGRRRRGGGCAHMLKKWPCARSRSVAHRRSSPLIPNSLPSPIFFFQN